jgi:GntR family transcriptional regulator
MTAPRSNTAGTEAPDFRPLYAQVKDLLVQRVIDGRWPPGTALPSEAQLALELRVSQGTVRKALDEMAAHRVVVRRQGRGTFVARHTNQQSLFHFFHIVDASDIKELPTSRIMALWTDRASRDQATRLALPPRSKVVMITRLRFLGGKPVLHERITLPGNLFEELKLPIGQEMAEELYVIYQQNFGISVARAKERIRAVCAGEDDVAHLGVPRRSPILEIDRVAIDLEGKPVEWRISHCCTEHYLYYNEIE